MSYFCLILFSLCFMTCFNFGFEKGFLSDFFLQMFSVLTYWLQFGAMKHFSGIIGLAATYILYCCN